MPLRTTRLFITGTPLAGATTLSSQLGALVHPTFDTAKPYREEGGWKAWCEALGHLRRALLVRKKLRTARASDVLTDEAPDVVAEREFLRVADGILFVVDSQTARREANLSAVAALRDVLTQLGRDVDTLPVVFALNKRDLADVDPVAAMSDGLRLGESLHVPTVASRGDGVDDVLEGALALISGTSRMPTATHRTLVRLLKAMRTSYWACAQNRSQLHQREQPVMPIAMSLMGTVEVQSDEVAGVVCSWLSGDWPPRAEKVAMLPAKSIWEQNVVRVWMPSSGPFPEYVAYMESIEALRAAALELSRAG